MSEIKLCKDCGHYNNWNGDCDVVRIDPVKGDGQKLFANTSRCFYCGILEAKDFVAKEQPKPKEPEHKGCPFCGGSVKLFIHGTHANEFLCWQCDALFVVQGVSETEAWETFNLRAENRLPEIKKCPCGSLVNLGS